MRIINCFLLLIISFKSFSQDIINIDGRYGAVNNQGVLIVPANYEHLLGFDESGLSVASKRIGNGVEDDAPIRFGMIDTNNRTVIQFKYNMLDTYNNDYAFFEYGSDTEGTTGISDNHETWKRGVIDRSGKEFFVSIIQGGRAKVYQDEACTTLIEIIDYNIPVNGLKTGRNAKGEPVVKVRYGQKVGWTWVEKVTDDNHQVPGLQLLQEEWKKKLASLTTDELNELYKY